MRFVKNSTHGIKTHVVDVVHNDTRTSWNLKIYQWTLDKANGSEIEDIFKHINDFFSWLPKEKQQAVADIYTAVRSIFDDVIDPRELHRALTKECKKLYEIITFEDVKYYVSMYANIIVPPSIKESYDQLEISERDQDSDKYKSKTYLKDTYLDLVYLGVYLKPMMPIWSEYIQILKHISSSSRSSYLEYEAMSLLSTSAVVETSPFNEFRTYIGNQMNSLEVPPSSILGGLGTTEIVDWLISQTFVRKLVIIQLSTTEDTMSVISVLFSHIKYTSQSTKRKFTGGDIIKLRKPSDKNDFDDASSKSVLEPYKIKERMSIGDLTALSVFAENLYNMSDRIDETIPRSMIEQCHKKILEECHRERIPAISQKIILRWIMSPALSPRSLDSLHRVAINNCFAVAQAALWHWGFHELAVILTGTETRDDQGMLLGGADVNIRMSKDHIQQIMVYYPHWQRKYGHEHKRNTNPACRSIEHTSELITHSDWRVNAPEELMRQSVLTDDRGIFVTPASIKHQLCDLVIYIAKHIESNTRNPLD